mgnify:FL=1|nr:MAG TPA: hyaluronidase [Caudoviricetes sp.]
MANKTLNVRISLFGATAAKWTEKNPVLLADEIGRERDTGKIKFGDGVSAWNDLPYFGGDMDAAISTLQDKLTALQGSKEGVVKAADKLATARKINGVAFDGTKDITIADDTKIALTKMGAASGVATLDATGHVPASQLPSFVDDVIEGYFNTADKLFYKEAAHTTKITGESGKIYTDLATGTIYRFGGTTFVSISNPLDIASESEAKAGTDDTKAMTPKKVKIVVDTVASTLEPKITSKGTAFNKDFGTTAGTVTEGNDPRLSDARTPKGSAGGDLTGTYPNPTIGAGKVTTAKIADSAVTDAKIAALSVMKLQINSGDTLILDGGTIE